MQYLLLLDPHRSFRRQYTHLPLPCSSHSGRKNHLEQKSSNNARLTGEALFIIDMIEEKKAIVSFLAGTALGAALGVIFAPKAGKEIRKDISKKAK